MRVLHQIKRIQRLTIIRLVGNSYPDNAYFCAVNKRITETRKRTCDTRLVCEFGGKFRGWGGKDHNQEQRHECSRTETSCTVPLLNGLRTPPVRKYGGLEREGKG